VEAEIGPAKTIHVRYAGHRMMTKKNHLTYTIADDTTTQRID
jgi:hypothetical protein